MANDLREKKFLVSVESILNAYKLLIIEMVALEERFVVGVEVEEVVGVQ